MSATGELEAAIVARIAAALTLPGQAHPKVDVRAWPERARDYKMTHPHGCAMVIYKGSKFSQDQATGGHLVAREADFELGLISRTLREPTAGTGPAGGTGQADAGVGAYDLLESCRSALLGWQPAQAAGVVRVLSETFDDYVEGTWGYSVRFVVPMLQVADRACPPGPWADTGPNSCCDTAPPISLLKFSQP